MSIYSHTPYFYIIEHIPTNMFYAGAKWEIGCNPETFMIKGGYTTSSNIVNKLIQETGIESFRIINIITSFAPYTTAYEYETNFLQSNNIANSHKWLNLHNNGNIRITFGTENFYNSMIQKYGVKHAQQSEEIRHKTIITNINKYGVENSAQNKLIQDKIKETNILRYGVDNVLKSKLIQDKIKETNVINLGVEYPLQNNEIQEKSKQTCLDKYGVEYSFQSETVKNKSKETNILKYGVEYYSQSEENRLSLSIKSSGSVSWNDGIKEYKTSKDEIPESHWVKGVLSRRKRTEEENEKNRQTHLGSKFYNDGIKNYKVLLGETPNPEWTTGIVQRKCPEYIKITKSTCPHCGIISNISNIKRYHMENCKYKSDIIYDLLKKLNEKYQLKPTQKIKNEIIKIKNIIEYQNNIL